jgi:hypothetical protein
MWLDRLNKIIKSRGIEVQEGDLYEKVIYEVVEFLVRENDIMKESLIKMRDIDYRGNRSGESVLAYQTLKKLGIE